MKGKTARAVHFPSSAAATVERHLDEVEERPGGFGQITDFGRPVVHLNVDVRGVLAIPRRRHLVIPYALQVGRHGPGTAAAHEQVAAELIVERRKAWVFPALLQPGEPFIGSKALHRGIRGRLGQHQLHSTKQLFVICGVCALEGGIRFSGSSEVPVAGRGRIATAIIRGGGDQQRHGIRFGYDQVRAGGFDPAPFVDGPQDPAELHTGRLQLILLRLEPIGTQI